MTRGTTTDLLGQQRSGTQTTRPAGRMRSSKSPSTAGGKPKGFSLCRRQCCVPRELNTLSPDHPAVTLLDIYTNELKPYPPWKLHRGVYTSFRCSVSKSCLTLCNPTHCSPWFCSQFTSTESVVLSNHLILCCPLLLLPLIFPGIRIFPMGRLFISSGHSIGVSASASVLPMNIQGWFPLGWTCSISLQSKGVSRVFSSTTTQKHQFFDAQASLWSNSHIHMWLLGKP